MKIRIQNMQLSKLIILSALMSAFVMFTAPSMAAGPTKGKTVYSEDEFLRAFSGKSGKVILGKLGKPVKKEHAVQPSSAAGVVGRMGQDIKSAKPSNVEMWYYSNIVSYAPKKTYKVIEMTFVNDRCMNIAFFNNR